MLVHTFIEHTKGNNYFYSKKIYKIILYFYNQISEKLHIKHQAINIGREKSLSKTILQ